MGSTKFRGGNICKFYLYMVPPASDWTKSAVLVRARLQRIRRKLKDLERVVWPKQGLDSHRWGIFLMDVEDCTSSIYMMKYGAEIPLGGLPFLHNPNSFPRMKEWQQAAALEVVYRFVQEGKVLGPFPGTTRICPITGNPMCFYPSFVVPKSTPGSYR